jgi:fatty-acyl-CoA synthase
MLAFFHPDKAAAEKATKNAIRGTWFYTGEAARLEGEKEGVMIKPLGALSDLIYSGSRYLLPGKIDDLAREVPDVADAAAFVRLDEKGKAAFALAVVKQGKLLSETQIFQHLKTKLSGLEVPLTIHFMDAIPRDKFDNIKRAVLQRQLSAR